MVPGLQSQPLSSSSWSQSGGDLPTRAKMSFIASRAVEIARSASTKLGKSLAWVALICTKAFRAKCSMFTRCQTPLPQSIEGTAFLTHAALRFSLKRRPYRWSLTHPRRPSQEQSKQSSQSSAHTCLDPNDSSPAPLVLGREGHPSTGDNGSSQRSWEKSLSHPVSMRLTCNI